MIDPALWYVLSSDGSEATETNGRLELTIHADAVPGGDYNQVDTQIGTHCHFAGDFDARVDFQLLRWPQSNGSYLQLAAFFDNGVASVTRNDLSSEGYSGNVPPHFSLIPSKDAKGRLRMKRVRGTISTYYWRRGRWVLLQSGPMQGYGSFGLQLFAPAASFGHVDIGAAFDNVVIEGTADPGPACPAA